MNYLTNTVLNDQQSTEPQLLVILEALTLLFGFPRRDQETIANLVQENLFNSLRNFDFNFITLSIAKELKEKYTEH